MARVSLRARLALITLVVVAAALIGANVAVNEYISSSLIDRRDDQLSSIVRFALTGLTISERPTIEGAPSDTSQGTNPNTDPNATTAPIPDASPGAAATDDRNDELPLDLAGAYTEIRDGEGHLLDSTFLFGGDRQLPKLPDQLVADSDGRYIDTETADGTPYRALAVAFPERGVTIVAALPLTDIDDTKTQLLLIQLIATGAVLVLAGALVWWLTGLGLRPLRRIQRTASAIAAGDLSERVEPAGDRTEIERLGTTLNQMLTEIEDAFAAQSASEGRLRQFISDASHELRTPLTTLRGYTELFERGAADDPEVLATAMRRVHDETLRMSHLVNDLLRLAQLDEERQLEPESVDLVPIIGDIAADARMIDPDRSVSVTAPDQLAVSGDRARLTQVVTNLVTNARTHTPAGSPIEIELASDGVEATITVIDHGPGIDRELSPRIFDRFVRQDASQRSGSGGTGLGLAIVATIASAHGGRCGVETTPGGGATFWVRLPIHRHNARVADMKSSVVRADFPHS